MRFQALSLAALAFAAALSTRSAQAQEATPRGCFKFSDASETVLIGYKARHRLQECPRTVVIPATVTEIGESAFYGKSLTVVVIPNSVTKIGEMAFAINHLTHVELGRSVTTIGANAFWSNKLSRVVIPNSVQEIGPAAFAENQLMNVEFGRSVTTIGEGAFFNNKLANVVIPSLVEEIGTDAFELNCLDADRILLPKALRSPETLEDILGSERQSSCQ